MKVCKRVHYWGTVQGVGFRYATLDLARGFPVTGSVRNLDNGQVELVAQGEAEDVQAFLAALASRMKAYIAGQVIVDEALDDFEEFGIRM